jgi:hypothetical protein
MQAAEALDFRVVFLMCDTRLDAVVGRENAVVLARIVKIALPFVKEEISRAVLVTAGSEKLCDVEATNFLGLTPEALFHRENYRDVVRKRPILFAERYR